MVRAVQVRKDGCLSRVNFDKTFGTGSRKIQESELSARAQSCIRPFTAVEDEDIIYRQVKGFGLPFEMQKMPSVSGKSWKAARVRAWGCFLSPLCPAAKGCQPTPCTQRPSVGKRAPGG